MNNITALFLFILSAGLFYTFINPTYQDAQALSVKDAEQKNVLRNISEIIEARDRLLVSYNALPPGEVEKLSKALPANVDTVRLALDLDNIASRYGISITGVALDTDNQNAAQVVLDESGRAYHKSLVSVSFISTYQNFRNFLADIERNLRIMDVRSVKFTTSEQGLYEHHIVIETYWVE